MLTGPRALKSINNIEKIQPRVMVATFNGNPGTTIIYYSPTNVIDETDHIRFYNEKSSLVRSIPKNNVLIIGGDMNAQIVKNINNKFSLHNSSNRNGQHLTDFSFENRLKCLKTKFQKRKWKLWTYTYANNAKPHIDYIFINKKLNNSALNLRVCPPITELSWQRYDWNYERMQPEKPQAYTMTGPCLMIGILG